MIGATKDAEWKGATREVGHTKEFDHCRRGALTLRGMVHKNRNPPGEGTRPTTRDDGGPCA
jgi:hypothetical protein